VRKVLVVIAVLFATLAATEVKADCYGRNCDNSAVVGNCAC
jgi:hypothetical protein